MIPLPQNGNELIAHMLAPLPDGHGLRSSGTDLDKLARMHRMRHGVGTVNHAHDPQQQHFIDQCTCPMPAQHKTCRDERDPECPLHKPFRPRASA